MNDFEFLKLDVERARTEYFFSYACLEKKSKSFTEQTLSFIKQKLAEKFPKCSFDVVLNNTGLYGLQNSVWKPEILIKSVNGCIHLSKDIWISINYFLNIKREKVPLDFNELQVAMGQLSKELGIEVKLDKTKIKLSRYNLCSVYPDRTFLWGCHLGFKNVIYRGNKISEIYAVCEDGKWYLFVAMFKNETGFGISESWEEKSDHDDVICLLETLIRSAKDNSITTLRKVRRQILKQKRIFPLYRTERKQRNPGLLPRN